MSTRTATCPKCLHGKVTLVGEIKCTNCKHVWLGTAAFDMSVNSALNDKISYLEKDIHLELDNLVAISKVSAIEAIEDEITERLEIIESSQVKNPTDSSLRAGTVVYMSMLLYLDRLKAKLLEGREDARTV